MTAIELGGSIQLDGFSELDHGSLIVVKKIVGNYTKDVSKLCTNFEKICLSLQKENDSFNLQASLLYDGKISTGNSLNKNLFMALDTALKDLDKKII